MLVTSNEGFPDRIPDLDIDLEYVDRRKFEFDAAGRSWKVVINVPVDTWCRQSKCARCDRRVAQIKENLAIDRLTELAHSGS